MPEEKGEQKPGGGAGPQRAALGGALGSIGTGMLGESVAFALGFALGRVLEPVGTKLRQEAWSADGAQLRAHNADTVAQLAAKYMGSYTNDKGELRDNAIEEAAQTGTNANRLAHLKYLAHSPPAPGELIELLRRDVLSFNPHRPYQGAFVRGLRENKLRAEWIPLIAQLRHQHLSAEDVATAIQRGIIRDPGYLIVDAPERSNLFKGWRFAEIDPEAEARTHGISPERLAVLTRLVGLPPGPQELLALLNRGVIDESDYRLGIAQGNLKTEWAWALKHLRRALLTPNNYAELHLRGWIDATAMHKGAALSGMEPGDTNRLFKMLGRPLVEHQIQTGIERGGEYFPAKTRADYHGHALDLLRDLVKQGYKESEAMAFVDAAQESNIRPEYYSLDIANRHTLPSAFVLRYLVQQGVITAADGEKLFRQSGWPPDLARKAAHALAKGSGAKVKQLSAEQLQAEYEGGFLSEKDFRARLEAMGFSKQDRNLYVELADARRVAGARTARINRIHTRFVGHKISHAQAATYLAKTGMHKQAQKEMMREWTAEREANQVILTPAQIKRAYKHNIYDRPAAVSLLEDQGYTYERALTLLDIPHKVSPH